MTPPDIRSAVAAVPPPGPRMPELLAPAGSYEKLTTAVH